MSNPATSVQPGRAALIQRTGDAFMRRLLRSPLHRMVSDKLLIVTVIGRKAGHVYENPVGYAEDDGAILIGTAARWPRNLRAGEPVSITLRGRTVHADWEVLDEEEAATECYRIILEHNPTHGKFAKVSLDPIGRVNRNQMRAALDRGTVVVRLRPRPALPDA
ncbi:nitroreductase/quinone reductase family protein [Nocardia acidivorans]|uniref:nitroreductase/quinone reductase family protein n=1 Tax=Nocardia acidivorans TaxID=404580 RepID=UPI000A01C985|nr:nitroreductase/quinone reductase family protein [Nocardia acidivorans]